ncbi:MAG TPA: peptidoglycan DD-metalloendopeptidase family protein [Geobacteraceae bacterium]
MHQLKLTLLLLLLGVVAPCAVSAGTLTWPIGCMPGATCLHDGSFHIGYPDVDGDGRAFDCGAPGYVGHTGTDITISSIEESVPVFAADDGEVLWVSGGKYDHCPNENEPDCKPELQPVIPGLTNKSPTCTDFGPSCGTEDCCLAWGFNAGNFILIMHPDSPDAALTFYAHLRKGSIVVANGQRVKKGEKIAEVGSSGASLIPHLHFGVWKKRQGRYELTEPWAGRCGPNFTSSLWQYNPPYRADITVAKGGTGTGIVTSSEGELSCGSSCALIAPPGTVLTLKATPYNGSQFIGWEGGCPGTDSTCTFVAEGNMKITAIFRDNSPPAIRLVAMPQVVGSNTVPITTFAAVDNVKVSGYLITETPTAPAPTTGGWSSTKPSSYACDTPGTKSLYAWVKDTAGNVSLPFRLNVTCGAFASAAPSSVPALPASTLPYLFNQLF